MVSSGKRITHMFRSAPVLDIDDKSRLIIMSDCHRGAGNPADDFGKNQTIYCAALKAYNRQRFTYIELGDGDELWENKRMSDIEAAHGYVFRILRQYFLANRLWMLYGNHDMEKRCRHLLLDSIHDDISGTQFPLFPGLKVHESLLLRYTPTGNGILLLHGHQVDFFNSTLWRLARFLVRYVWQRLNLVGFGDPTSAAKNNRVKLKIERRLTRWAAENTTPVISGHTHRPVFPMPGQGRYFNDGCCIHPWSVSAIEIVAGTISLVKWGLRTGDDGVVRIGKDTVAGPRRLTEYW